MYFTTAVLSQNIYSVPLQCQHVVLGKMVRIRATEQEISWEVTLVYQAEVAEGLKWAAGRQGWERGDGLDTSHRKS